MKKILSISSLLIRNPKFLFSMVIVLTFLIFFSIIPMCLEDFLKKRLDRIPGFRAILGSVAEKI